MMFAIPMTFSTTAGHQKCFGVCWTRPLGLRSEVSLWSRTMVFRDLRRIHVRERDKKSILMRSNQLYWRWGALLDHQLLHAAMWTIGLDAGSPESCPAVALSSFLVQPAPRHWDDGSRMTPIDTGDFLCQICFSTHPEASPFQRP